MRLIPKEFDVIRSKGERPHPRLCQLTWRLATPTISVRADSRARRSIDGTHHGGRHSVGPHVKGGSPTRAARAARCVLSDGDNELPAMSGDVIARGAPVTTILGIHSQLMPCVQHDGKVAMRGTSMQRAPEAIGIIPPVKPTRGCVAKAGSTEGEALRRLEIASRWLHVQHWDVAEGRARAAASQRPRRSRNQVDGVVPRKAAGICDVELDNVAVKSSTGGMYRRCWWRGRWRGWRRRQGAVKR